MEKYKIVAIIVTYNGMKWIDKCLKSVQNSTYPLTTVIIDNKSSDETVPFIKKNYPEVVLLESDKNLGFGQANNLGFNYAIEHHADFVFLLNQDAYISPDMLDKLLSVPSPEKQGIIAPVQLNGNGSKLDVHFHHYVTPQSAPGLVESYLIGKQKLSYEVQLVNAAAWLLPIRTLMEVGGFDPIFFHYGEDHHYCDRVRFHGKPILLVPDALVCHDRETAGNVELHDKNIEKRTLMNAYLNISVPYNKLSSYMRFTNLKYLQTVLKAFCTFNFTQVHSIFMAYWYIWTHKKTIKKNRAKNEIVGPNWL